MTSEMKTPEEIIDDAARDAWCSMRTHHEHIIEALDTAGYAIVPKEPTEEMQRVAADYLGFDPNEPTGLAWATRISLWRAMIAAKP